MKRCLVQQNWGINWYWVPGMGINSLINVILTLVADVAGVDFAEVVDRHRIY